MKEEILDIKNSIISGKGVFAKKLISKGETICFMEGELMSLDEMINRVDSNLENGSDPLGVDDETYLDLEELPRSINHSCCPNAFIKGKNELIALKNINKGEEITYDYSTTMDDNREKIESTGGTLWTIKCRCGNKDCRKRINQFKTLPFEKQRYYIENKLAPDFILKKFSKN